MKSIYLLLTAILVANFSSAQWKDAPFVKKEKELKLSIENNSSRPDHSVNFENYERGDAFWIDGFDDPATWTIENDEEFGWEIGDDVFGWGFWLETPISSTSGGNYAFVWNGDPNEGGLQPYIHTMTTANPIDVSMLESGQLEFEYYGAAFVSELFEIQVSNDGIGWITVDDLTDIPITSQGNPNETDNPALRSTNITPYIAGQDDLYIRFSFTLEELGANTGVCYGWFVDDVAIRSVPENSLSIVSSTYSDLSTAMVDEYGTYTPEQQGTLSFRTDVENLGAADQLGVTMTVSVNGEEVGTTDPTDILVGETDSLIIQGYSVPTAPGIYNVEFEINGPNEDFDPADNVDSHTFQVDEWLFGRDKDFFDFPYPAADFSSGQWRAGPYYEIFEDGTVYAIDVALWNWDDFVPGGAMTAYIMDPAAMGIDEDDEWAQSEEITVPEENLNTIDNDGDLIWTTLVLEEPYEVFAGDLIHATVDGFNTDFRIIGEQTETPGGGWAWEGNGWVNYIDVNWAVRLNFNPDAELVVNQEELTENSFSIGQNFPNPAVDVTRINYTLQEAAEVNLEVFDLTGKVILNDYQGNLPAGNHFLEINVSDLASGVYQYSVIVDEMRITRPMMVK